MSADAVHPADPILQAYGLGKLDDASSAWVNKHLDGCAPCRNRVSEMSADSFLGRLRGAQARPDEPGMNWAHSVSPTDRGPSGMTGPPPADTMPPGLVDHPYYDEIEELGRGGMGVVYLAQNRLMGRKEVLKVMSRHIMDRPGLFDRFMAEIRAVGRLHHPNIVTAYSAFWLGESIVFAMEYVEGRDLAKMIKTKGPLPVVNASYYVSQAAQGMQHAHEQGMVHRDIKPGNLMLSHKAGRALIKILDFGLAKATREAPVDGGLTSPGQAMGTPDFMAPEQIRDAQKADIRADIYSLGCTLYYLLSGGPPFRAENLLDLYLAHDSMDAKLLNFVRPDVPGELAAVVAKMMAKEPGRRFQTPSDVSQALVPFFKKASANARVPNPEVSQVAPSERRPEPPAREPVPTQPATSLAPAPAPRKPMAPIESEPRWESLIEFKETEPLTDPAPAAIMTTVQKSRRLWPAAAAGLLLMGLIVAWALVLSIRTTNGTIVLENVPEDAVVEIDGKKIMVAPTGSEPVEIEIQPGKYAVCVKRGEDVLLGESVTVQSGEHFKLTVRLEASGTDRPEKTESSSITQPAPEPAPALTDRTRFTVVAGKWNRTGDELVQLDTAKSSCSITFGDDQWADYDFTVDAMRVGGSDSFSLFFRSTTWGNEFEYVLAGDGNEVCHIYNRDQRGTAAIKSYEFNLQNGAWYTVHVHVRGGHLVGSIHDSQNSAETRVFDIFDDSHPRGRVGLQTFGASVRFKNIKVTAADGKVLWEGPPAVDSTEPSEVSGPADQAKPLVGGQDGFVPLFNGKDLMGWCIDRGGPHIWHVDDGVLVVAAVNDWRRQTFLLSDRDFADFILRFEFQLPGSTDSGIVLRAIPGEHHMEVNLRNFNDPPGVHAQTAALNWSTSGRGVDYLPPDRPAELGPDGGWNEMEIMVRSASLRVSVNGREVRNTDLRQLADRPNALPGLKRRSGRIGFQSHTGKVSFRRIEIKDLSLSSTDPPSKPAARGTLRTAEKALAQKPSERRTGTRASADAKRFRDKLYKLFPQQLSWHEARLKCLQLGGHLAVVKTEEENRFLTSLMRSQGVSVVWLGATDEEVEGRWVWVDGEPLRYNNWNPTQPNNKQGVEHYMIMISGNSAAMSRGAQDGKWHDQPNDSVQFSPGFICQWD